MNHFVTVYLDPTDTDWRALLGPFPTHDLASFHVPFARGLAETADSKAGLYLFSTACVQGPTDLRGLFNPLLEPELVATTFAQDDLVRATAPGVSVESGDMGRVIEDGTHEYHRVYWPGRKLVAYHLGTALRLIGHLDLIEEGPDDAVVAEAGADPDAPGSDLGTGGAGDPARNGAGDDARASSTQPAPARDVGRGRRGRSARGRGV